MTRILSSLTRRLRDLTASVQPIPAHAGSPAPYAKNRSAQEPTHSHDLGSLKNRSETLRKWLLRILTVTVAMPISIACAQTVSISPTGYVTTGLGSSVQFTATVTGATNTAVKWYSGGTLGGNSTAGTISTSGLYTAPTSMPGQNPVAIKAVSLAKPTVSATQYISLLSTGPTITSVSPNPISIGGLTVTIKGSGFKQYATVLDTSNGSPVQMTTKSVTADTIIADGYQPNATSATFTVTNPGSTPSNSITVPVTNGVKTYTLTVNNGTGGGNYAAGTNVQIHANAPPAGQNFFNWTGAAVANATASTTTLTMPAAATSVTANYTSGTTTYQLTVNNGSGSGLYTAGTVVTITANTPPAGNVFANWTGATVGSAVSATTTLAMPAAAANVTANYTVAQQVPYPNANHPRLWVTPADLPKYQSWAVASNPVYQQGMLPLLNTAVTKYQNQFFPNGVPNANYPDFGDSQGYAGELTEEVGFVLAFNSLIDPNPANRIKYAQYTRNLLMYAMNEAAKGVLANTPFRDPLFPVYNRGNLAGGQWALMVDWIYNAKDAQNQPILTAADKLTIRNVFMIWANECLNASTTGGDHPAPIGATNSFSLIGGGNRANRMASNNYYLGHARMLTMMALSLDPTDDPTLDSSKSPAALGNSLRSYILNANGAWLYQIYAMMGDAQSVKADYNLPGTGANFGLASGGLPPEGMLYGHSFGFLLGQLLALQTAGFNDTTLSGPQIKLITSPVWDRYVTGFISSLTPTSATPPSQPWLGPVYQFASYGDLLRLWVTPDNMVPFELLALLERQLGNTTHLNAARWFAQSAAQGTLSYNVSQPWTWGTQQSIVSYMLLDPSLAPATDPRPNYPLTFLDPDAGRILARTSWNINAVWFDYRASWTSINHQQGDAGQFEFFRNGEWLTKEMSNYDNNGVGQTSYYHNTLALQNWCANGTPNLNWFETGEWANGAQWMLGLNAGDPVTVTSNGPSYTYAATDMTGLYNRPNMWTPASAAVDITQATRSILWLNADYIVVYDRATSVHSGLFKTFNLSFATPPAINGNVATETMASGQKLFTQTLLPLSPTLSSRMASGDLNPHSDLDPMFFVLSVQDKSLPTDTRFLHVLQGSDPNGAMVPATYVTSTSGTVFDGAIFGTCAVFFPNKANTALAVTTFTVPANVHTFVVTGLAANASYNISRVGNVVTLTPAGSGNLSDSAGLLKVAI